MKKNNIFLSIFVIYLIICIICSPNRFMDAMLNGISIWTFNVLPSILPFMILTSLLIQLNSLEKFSRSISKPFSKVYRTSPESGYTFILSILAGYPLGSKMIAELYESGKIGQNDAFKMSSFCSNSGPMFIIGSVGVGMFINQTAGYILFLSHVFSALINGLFYRNLHFPNEKTNLNVNKKEVTFNDIISSSIQGILNIAVIISLFFVVTESLSPLLNLFPDKISSVLKGVIEMTQGCLSVSKSFNIKWAIPICSFLISFGGISTLIQSIVLLKKVNMPIWLFTLQKFTHGIVALIIALIFSILIF